jgi:hypothetical protein
MANVLTELPKISRKGAGGRRGSKYPLDEWFDGQVRELVRGTPEQVDAGEADFSAKDSSIVNMLHTQASARNLKLKSVKTETGIAVVAFAIEETNGKTEQPEEKPAKDKK